MRTNDPNLDKMIPEQETSVIAAIGPLNSKNEANAHSATEVSKDDVRIDFTSKNVHECTNSLNSIPDSSGVKAWPPAKIFDGDTFTAKIGPTGGKKGYTSITGTTMNYQFYPFILLYICSML